MQKRVAFVTTSHLPKDDRIYYHLAMSLIRNGYAVSIIGEIIEADNKDASIQIIGYQSQSLSKSDKVFKIYQLLIDCNPNIIICSDPLPIVASRKFNKRINNKVPVIYDITEWYPSKKNLQNISGIKKIMKFCKLLLFNLYASWLADAFIFGEHYKSVPYKTIFPFKKTVKVGYYTNLEYIHYIKPKLHKKQLCLGYTGKITVEKGINNFLNVVKSLMRLNNELKLKLKIVGWFPNEEEEISLKNKLQEINEIEFELYGYQEFSIFSDIIQDVDIFFDLRKTDFENRHCLPIKLFYYLACGRPVIYSNLKAIKKELDILPFGYLVNPRNSEFIARCIMEYVNNPFLYYRHCLNARKIAENQYNWDKIEPVFLKFIAEFVS